MKPASFDYRAADSVQKCVEILASDPLECEVLAGGQSLVPLMNMRLARPATLVDVNGIANLSMIQRSSEGAVTIGALARQSDAEESHVIMEHVPLLAEALPVVGHRGTRNRGTVVGSAVHADPAGEIPAILRLLGGEIVAESVRGRTVYPAASFMTGMYETALEPDEFVTGMSIWSQSPRQGSAWEEFSRRHGDYCIAACGAVVDPSGFAKAVVVGLSIVPAVVDVTELLKDQSKADSHDAAAHIISEGLNIAVGDNAEKADLHETAAALLIRCVARAQSRASM